VRRLVVVVSMRIRQELSLAAVSVPRTTPGLEAELDFGGAAVVLAMCRLGLSTRVGPTLLGHYRPRWGQIR
jgi:hypothetical protein